MGIEVLAVSITIVINMRRLTSKFQLHEIAAISTAFYIRIQDPPYDRPGPPVWSSGIWKADDSSKEPQIVMPATRMSLESCSGRYFRSPHNSVRKRFKLTPNGEMGFDWESIHPHPLRHESNLAVISLDQIVMRHYFLSSWSLRGEINAYHEQCLNKMRHPTALILS